METRPEPLEHAPQAPREGAARDRLEGLTRRAEAWLRESGAGAEGAVEPTALVRLLDISRAMNRIHDLDELLGYVTERLRELFNASNGFVILFDADGRPVIQASRLGDETDDSMPVSETILRRLRETRRPILIDNAAEIEELRNQSSIERYRIASVLCAPLVVGNEVMGALQFDHRGDPHPFPPEDLRLLELFAGQAATAFYNLQLIDRLDGARRKVEEAQERVVQSERLSALGEMAAGMAHDFNNTLFVALGFCDVLLAKDSIESEVRAAIERIRTCSLDAANTVRRLQTFARGGALDGRNESVDCRAIVAEMPEYTRHKWASAARRRGVRIEVSARAGATPPVAANPADIREVLTNLIFNAVDAVEGRGGTVEIESGVQGDRVFVAVRDDGVGMDEETRRRVFEPFYSTKGARGSGFGLSVCWSIARRMGGDLQVRSEKGAGSTFTLLLPVAEAWEVAPEAPEPGPQRSARIVVVDDEPDVLETISRLVRSLGHQVEAFPDPARALERCSGGAPGVDLLLTDLDLGVPSCTGFDLARSMLEVAPEVPVVVLTGWGSGEEAEPQPENVRAVLAKPVTRERLRSSLAELLVAG